MNATIPTIAFELDGRAVEALPGDTLIQRGARPGYDTGIYQFLFGMTE